LQNGFAFFDRGIVIARQPVNIAHHRMRDLVVRIQA
jgi:hypothetical protein